MEQRPFELFSGATLKREESLLGRAPIMLTPLVDMFTILLIFLLMNYSTGGQLMYMVDSIIMPESLSREQLETGVEISVGTDRIYVDGDLIMEGLADWYASNKLLIPALYVNLKEKSTKYKNMELEVPFFRFAGKATVQADKTIPYRFLKKILYTADRADFPNISLAVFKRD